MQVEHSHSPTMMVMNCGEYLTEMNLRACVCVCIG